MTTGLTDIFSDAINICPFQIISCKKELELISGIITFIIIFDITRRWKMGFFMCQCLWAAQDKSWIVSADCSSFPQKKFWVMLHTWFTEMDLTYCIPNSSSPFLSFYKRIMLCFSMWIISLCANHRINEVYRPISSSGTPLLYWCTHYTIFSLDRNKWEGDLFMNTEKILWIIINVFILKYLNEKEKIPRVSEVLRTSDFNQN